MYSPSTLSKSVQKTYFENQINNASNLDLVIMTHDYILKACQMQDEEKTRKGLQALSDALDFSYPEISLGLHSIYQWCLRCLVEKNFAEIQNTIQTLKESWQTVQQQQNQNKNPNLSVLKKA